MEIAKPLLRLLLACLLVVTTPIYLGMNRLSLAWLLAPVIALTFISCTMQGYRGAGLIALCALSILVTLGAIYAASYGLAELL